MENEWLKFIKSGSVADYLKYVDSCKENKISDGVTNTFYNRGFSNKGNENRGE